MNQNNIIRRPFKYRYFFATYILIGINLLVFILTSIFPRLVSYLALNAVNVIHGHAYWQFLTYMFVHGGFMHLFSNMLGLFFFGITLERALGSSEFLLFYLVTGFLSGVLSFLVYVLTKQYNVFLLGASGAVYAVLLLFAVAFPKSKIYVWGILPVPAPILVAIYAVLEIGSEIFSIRGASRGENIAHLTHLFGFGIAWLYSVVRLGQNPWKVWRKNLRS